MRIRGFHDGNLPRDNGVAHLELKDRVLFGALRCVEAEEGQICVAAFKVVEPRALPGDGAVERGEADVGRFELAAEPCLGSRELPEVLCCVERGDELTGDSELEGDVVDGLGAPTLEVFGGGP